MKMQIGANTVEMKKLQERAYNDQPLYQILVNGEVVGKTYASQPSNYDSFGVYRKMGAKQWNIQMDETKFERVRYKFNKRSQVAEYVVAKVLQSKQQKATA